MSAPGIPVNPTGPNSVDPVAPVSAAGELSVKDNRSISSLSKSEQEDVMRVLLANAYMPILTSPNWDAGTVNVSITNIIASVEKKFAEMGSQMWDDYLKNLSVISEQIAERIKSPQYQARIEDSEPLNIKHVLNNNESLVGGMTSYVSNHKDDKDAVPFMAMALVVAAGMVAMSVVNVASTSMVAANPIVDAASIASQVLPPALADSSVMVINLLLPAMLYSTSFAIINGSGTSKGEKELDLEFARNYAQNILGKVGGNDINQFLGAMLVSKFEGDKPISKDQLDRAVITTKLVMLSVAFALFYKVETGWLSGLEFAKFIQENPYKEGTVEFRLIETIKLYLKLIPPDDSSTTLEELMAYFDRNPDVDELLSPEKAFSKMYTPYQREIDAA
jgi:hypothetical protein